MTDSEVFDYRNSIKGGYVLCCEIISGNRCRITQISLKGCDVLVKLSDGTTAKPPMIRSIQAFAEREIVTLQKFLINQ